MLIFALIHVESLNLNLERPILSLEERDSLKIIITKFLASAKNTNFK